MLTDSQLILKCEWWSCEDAIKITNNDATVKENLNHLDDLQKKENVLEQKLQFTFVFLSSTF